MQKYYLSPNDLAYKKELHQYILKVIISEASKIIIFFFAAFYLNLVKEYFSALFFLMLLRNCGGGLHFHHYISCLFVSFIFLFSSILLAYILQPNQLILQISLLFCAFLGYILVPVTSSNRPPATDQQQQHSKQNTLFIITIYFFVICICPLNLYLYIGFWTIILHIFQLSIAHIKGGVKNVHSIN